jgi:hypothetical protein
MRYPRGDFFVLTLYFLEHDGPSTKVRSTGLLTGYASHALSRSTALQGSVFSVGGTLWNTYLFLDCTLDTHDSLEYFLIFPFELGEFEVPNVVRVLIFLG